MYATLIGPCIRCGRIFGCNPLRVPSTRAITGHREPLCEPCYNVLAKQRIKLGLPAWPDPAPDAWQSCDEGEL